MTGMAEPGPDALLDFGRSIDPISTNGADYAPQKYTAAGVLCKEVLMTVNPTEWHQ